MIISLKKLMLVCLFGIFYYDCANQQLLSVASDTIEVIDADQEQTFISKTLFYVKGVVAVLISGVVVFYIKNLVQEHQKIKVRFADYKRLMQKYNLEEYYRKYSAANPAVRALNNYREFNIFKSTDNASEVTQKERDEMHRRLNEWLQIERNDKEKAFKDDVNFMYDSVPRKLIAKYYCNDRQGADIFRDWFDQNKQTYEHFRTQALQGTIQGIDVVMQEYRELLIADYFEPRKLQKKQVEPERTEAERLKKDAAARMQREHEQRAAEKLASTARVGVATSSKSYQTSAH